MNAVKKKKGATVNLVS